MITKKSPATLAEEAAEAIMWINRLTLYSGPSRRGYSTPVDVDATLGCLLTFVDRLPQALIQMSQWISNEAAGGWVHHTAHFDDDRSDEAALDAVSAIAGHVLRANVQLQQAGASMMLARSMTTYLVPKDGDQGR